MQHGGRGRPRLMTRRTERRRRIAGAAGAITLALALGAQAAHASPGTVGEWRFDEPVGQTALDGGPFGLDGRLGTSTGVDAADPQRIPGVASGALRFGGGAYVQLPDAAQLAPPTLSAEAVVRAPASPGAYHYIVSRGGQGCFAGSYGLYTAKHGGVAFYAFDGSGYVVSAAARASDVWNGGWHHIAGTFDGGRLRLYVDGRAVGDPSDGPTRIDWSTTSPTRGDRPLRRQLRPLLRGRHGHGPPVAGRPVRERRGGERDPGAASDHPGRPDPPAADPGGAAHPGRRDAARAPAHRDPGRARPGLRNGDLAAEAWSSAAGPPCA